MEFFGKKLGKDSARAKTHHRTKIRGEPIAKKHFVAKFRLVTNKFVHGVAVHQTVCELGLHRANGFQDGFPGVLHDDDAAALGLVEDLRANDFDNDPVRLIVFVVSVFLIVLVALGALRRELFVLGRGTDKSMARRLDAHDFEQFEALELSERGASLCKGGGDKMPK